MNRAELKSLAKEQIQGRIGILFLIMLIVGLITGAAVAVPVVGSVACAVVLTPVFTLALVKIFLGMTYGEAPEIAKLFADFNKFWSAFKVTFLVGLFVSLWSLLFVIPGIVKALSYSQAMYILAENPDIGAREAINRSKAMMEGHKMELFVLGLSFIGWHLLGAVTIGIAYIYVLPYMNATMANFYNRVKGSTAVEG